MDHKNDDSGKVIEILQKIRKQDPKGLVAVIARYNKPLQTIEKELSRVGLGSGVKFWTFHKSKGLEADYCILLGLSQGRLGFPSARKDHVMVEALLPSMDDYQYAEERRLLYVGITRAKNEVYILADPGSPSEFVLELLAPVYNLNIVSEKFQQQYREIFKCPKCVKGYLKRTKGKFSDFYVCSTGIGCDLGKARICEKCESPSIDELTKSVCNNQNCGNTLKICDRCGRKMTLRSGKFGSFWGCAGYGLKEDSCTNKYKA